MRALTTEEVAMVSGGEVSWEQASAGLAMMTLGMGLLAAGGFALAPVGFAAAFIGEGVLVSSAFALAGGGGYVFGGAFVGGSGG